MMPSSVIASARRLPCLARPIRPGLNSHYMRHVGQLVYRRGEVQKARGATRLGP